MGWRCDICDSYNEESNLQCYVCGQERSRESILEGKLRARRERSEKIKKTVADVGSKMLSGLFIAGVVCGVTAVFFMLAGKISGGGLGDITDNISAVAKNAFYGAADNSIKNVTALFGGAIESPLIRLSHNGREILLCFSSAIMSLFAAARLVLKHAGQRMSSSYNEKGEALGTSVQGKLGTLSGAAEAVFDNIKGRLACLPEIIKTLASNVMSYFK